MPTFRNLSAPVFIAVLMSCLIIACSKPQATLPLSINSISVNKGGYSSKVVITGTGFNTATAENKVLFNGMPAPVTSATNTQLTVTVPLRAGTGAITVTVNGQTATGPVFTYFVSAVVSNYAGSGSKGASNGSGAAASFNYPSGLVFDAPGNLYVADANNFLIRKINTNGVVSTFAGSGGSGSINGPGSQASFVNFAAMTIDPSGNIFVTEFNDLIRKITPGGIVSTVLDGGNVPDYSFDYPSGLAFDASGNLYVSIFCRDQIHKITPNGVISNFAGNGFYGSDDGTPGSFSGPANLTFDAAGTLYVADYNNNRIRSVDPSGKVSTIAGKSSGLKDGDIATALFNGPKAVAMDAAGNMYVADSQNNAIRMISADRKTVTTIAGTGVAGSANGAGNIATFNCPIAITLDTAGNIYVADAGNNTIRKITME